MKRPVLTLILIALASVTVSAQGYGIAFGDVEVTAANASDIFGDGLAAYDATQNTLTLKEGLDYHLSKYFVTIATGRDMHIRLEGDAQIVASVDCSDNLFVETTGDYALKITANISGSALKCPNLTVEQGVNLELLSRNSQADMYALDCAETLTVNSAVFSAEVTTSNLAVAVHSMTLNGCWLQKPRGGIVSPYVGGICFGDGIAAKQVRIVVSGFGIDEDEPSSVEGKVLKTIENGQIVIERDGVRYNVKGQKL